MTSFESQNLHWYKDAIIYEVHVRAFQDSNDDGIGDFRGLTQKLDYLQDLGVTALWLLPFYPSPLKDDGYDIADYRSINPIYGEMRDFKRLLREARRRGLHVITELVINHTSDQHPWFQRARSAPRGSRYRDFYVWSDSPDKYEEARIIFQDTETSNWTWDREAGAYYWHRFYSHQPDLNFDNPLVRRAIRRVLDYWMRMGVSGMRLDAIPYLFEREDTNCENLPETHAYLKELRQHVDANYPGRIFISEANQWPEDAVEYFGDGDETHMAFHFPLMPRLFMALQMEDSRPVRDILDQTPEIPESSQWAIFLRNHDELTLEMVTDEERDFMYRMYAHDRHMRINLGIRRRLAPLMNNDRRKIELMYGLLFSMPGTPVVYYGDEIGIGDNFYLGDRDAVRTPMQWNPDRNAGFSKANPQQLFLPVVVDYEYHYEAVNVEAQQRNPDSLLWWMKRIMALRKHHPAFGRGEFSFVKSSDVRVLAYVRRFEDEEILVVANLSRVPQHVRLELPAHAGKVPTELFGGDQFPQIDQTQYSLSLGPFGFYWFSLGQSDISDEPFDSAREPATVSLTDRTWASLFGDETPASLVQEITAFLRTQRWFGGKARTIRRVSIQDHVRVTVPGSSIHALFVSLTYRQGEPETYFLPIAFATDEDDSRSIIREGGAICWVAVRGPGRTSVTGLAYDALARPEFATALLNAIGTRRRFRSSSGSALACRRTRAFRLLREQVESGAKPVRLSAEQSNTSMVFGDRLALKFYRRVQPGINPDLEIGQFLTDQARFSNIPAVGGWIELVPPRGGSGSTVAMLQQFVEAYGNAWDYSLEVLRGYRERAEAHAAAEGLPELPPADSLVLAEREVPTEISDLIGPFIESARMIGQRTAEMHLALASGHTGDFAREPFSRLYQRALFQSLQTDVRSGFEQVRSSLDALPAAVAEQASHLAGMEARVLSHLERLLDHRIQARRIRIHGDYHLGQVLRTATDFVIIDFEGEPLRPLSERRLKRSPLRDVAGMLRSFHYAASIAMDPQTAEFAGTTMAHESDHAATLWYRWVGAAFVRGYRDTTAGSDLLPADDDDFRLLLETFLMHKALYEVNYELNNRPGWLHVPVRGLVSLVESW